MDTVPQAIEKWQRKEIGDLGLLRQLESFGEWQIPLSGEAAVEMLSGGENRFQISETPQGMKSLYLFSSSAAFEHFLFTISLPPREQHFLSVPGTWAFAQDFGVDRLVIDPNGEQSVEYSKDSFPLLKRMGAALEIEELLTELRTNEESPMSLYSKVKAYPLFIVVGIKDEGGTRLALAPDGKGRSLAAVLTFDDCLDAFLAEIKQALPDSELSPIAFDGEGLCRQLSQMTLQGVVFNPCGPIPQMAFTPEFPNVVLRAS